MSTKIKSLTVPGVLESLSVIRQYVADASAVAGLFPDQTYGLSLAIDEIATNVVMHGYKKSGLTGNISVSAEVSENDIIFRCIALRKKNRISNFFVMKRRKE